MTTPASHPNASTDLYVRRKKTAVDSKDSDFGRHCVLHILKFDFSPCHT